MMYCQNCGKQINETPCPYCGFSDKQKIKLPTFEKKQPAPQEQPQTPQPTVVLQNTNVIGGYLTVGPKKKVTALLLCIFLGFLGAHRFYVGKTGSGVLYLCTAGLLGIGWVVDIFIIAVGGFRDVNGMFLQ
nr:MAG TPA: TM2 domain [Caudoviricetes sp.]